MTEKPLKAKVKAATGAPLSSFIKQARADAGLDVNRGGTDD